MAIRWLIASGNVNDPTKWDGGTTVPGTGDTCVANGFTGTINVDFTCAEIRTLALGGGVSGGGWTLSSGVTLTANVLAGTSDCVTASSGDSTIIGNITAAAGVTAKHGVNKNASGTLTITGNVAGGGAGSTQGYGVYCPAVGSGSVVVNGSVYGGSGTASSGIRLDSTATTLTVNGTLDSNAGNAAIQMTAVTSATVTGSLSFGSVRPASLGVAGSFVYNGTTRASSSNSAFSVTPGSATITLNGDVYGPTSGSSVAISVTGGSITINGNVYGDTAAGVNCTSGTLIINGNITGSSTTSSIRGVTLSSTGSIGTSGTISGTISGGTQALSHGIINTGTGSITYTGNVIAGSSTGEGINLTSTGSVTVTGNVAASSTANGITSSSTGNITVNGVVTAANGFSGIRRTSTTTTHKTTVNGTQISNATSGHPAVQTLGILLVGKNRTQQQQFATDAGGGSIGPLRTLSITNGISGALGARGR